MDNTIIHLLKQDMTRCEKQASNEVDNLILSQSAYVEWGRIVSPALLGRTPTPLPPVLSPDTQESGCCHVAY